MAPCVPNRPPFALSLSKGAICRREQNGAVEQGPRRVREGFFPRRPRSAHRALRQAQGDRGLGGIALVPAPLALRPQNGANG